MQIDIESLLRRLVLMGVPLLPVGCDRFTSCPESARQSVEQYVEIANPAGASDGGFTRITEAAYRRCVDALDCTDLCMEHFASWAVVESCERVATDGFAGGDDKVAIQARVIPLCEGRRPEGQGAPAAPARSRCDVGDYLARAAYLEGVSVSAFRRLARELAAHGAPAALVDAAARAARDEVRHRRSMTALARRFGAEPAAIPAGLPAAVRPLEAVAMENAAEGCVRETLGAIVAREQAGRAADGAIRAGLRAIARDEARHAELGFAVDAWSSTRLSAAARRHVRAARAAELDTVARDVDAAPVPFALHRTAGLPTRAATRTLVSALTRLLAT